MAKYDEQLKRMMHLIDYDNTLNESKKTNSGIECHRTAADGKEYGIIKEGAYYYIKTTTPDKMNMVESYDYLNGFNRRNETRYNSYNSATKQLELHLMSINEAYGKHEDVTVANLNSSKEAFSILTEDARKELDRMHMIFENSFISKDNIGNHGDPEKKGSSTGANTTKNNAPFEEKTEAKLDKVVDKKGTVDGATSDYTKVGDADSKLQHADKMEKGKSGDEEYKDAHDDLEGEGVADKKPSGAKAVKMNESFEDEEYYEGDMDFAPEIPEAGEDHFEEEQELLDNDEIFGGEETLDGVEPEVEDEIVGFEEEEPMEDDLDALLREFLDYNGASVNLGSNNSNNNNATDSMNGNNLEAKLSPLEEEEINEFLDYNAGGVNLGSNNSGNNNMSGSANGNSLSASLPIPLEEEDKIVGPDPVLDGPHGKGNSVHGEKTMDRIEEAVERITRMVVESLCKEEKKCKCGKKNCTCKDGECTCDKNVNEGQGWRVFKHGVKNFDTLPDNEQEYDELFQDGELTNYEHNLEGRPYYDENGGYTDDAYDKHGMRHGKVEDTTLGKLGRKAGIAALKGMSKGKIAKKKWDLAHPKKQDGIAYLQEAIDKIVKEEVTKLDVWGKHPRYRKEPMSTPANKDVKAGTADKDWCDASVKGNQAYGQKIGSSAPFEKEVDTLTEKVFEAVKKTLVKKTGK